MTALQQRMLDRLSRLKPGTTMCPGQLARDCGTTLRTVREEMLDLAKAKKIALSQRDKLATPESLKGPFRVRLR